MAAILVRASSDNRQPVNVSEQGNDIKSEFSEHEFLKSM